MDQGSDSDIAIHRHKYPPPSAFLFSFPVAFRKEKPQKEDTLDKHAMQRDVMYQKMDDLGS